MWGDLIRTCITIKLNNYDSEILIIDKSPLKLDVIDCINIDKGIKELKRLNIKREFIKNLKEIIKKYNIKEVFFVVQNSRIIIYKLWNITGYSLNFRWLHSKIQNFRLQKK